MAMAPKLMRSPASRQFILGQNLQNQSLNTSPILSNTQGFARLAQALAGGLLQRDAQQKFKEEQAADAANLASMLGGAGVDPSLAQLFGSDVPGAPQVGAALLQGRQVRDAAQIKANAKATTATIVSGNTPEGQRLGIPEGQSASVTVNNRGAITDIGKPFDSNQSTFPGTSSTSGAMNVLTRGATRGETDTAEYAAAYALLGKPRTITMPDGRTVNEPGMNLSAFPAPTFGAQTPATQPPPPPTTPPATDPAAPEEQPTPEASQEPDEPSPKGVRETKVTVGADETYADETLPEFRADKPNIVSNLQKLDDVIRELETRDDITGFGPNMMLRLGEAIGMRGQLAPSAADTADRINQVVQESIRQLLGPQFTENEAKMILQRAFDPSQDESVNLKRVRELREGIARVLDAKQRQEDYFAKNGTLRGFESRSYADFKSLLTGGEAVKPLQTGETTVINGVTIERTK